MQMLSVPGAFSGFICCISCVISCSIGVSESCLACFRSFLRNRSQRVKVDSVLSDSKQLCYGMVGYLSYGN